MHCMSFWPPHHQLNIESLNSPVQRLFDGHLFYGMQSPFPEITVCGLDSAKTVVLYEPVSITEIKKEIAAAGYNSSKATYQLQYAQDVIVV